MEQPTGRTSKRHRLLSLFIHAEFVALTTVMAHAYLGITPHWLGYVTSGISGVMLATYVSEGRDTKS